MSEDLVKQARLTALMHADGTPVDSADALLLEMADRIEELKGQVAWLLRWAPDNHEALTCAEAAEAKMAKAMSALNYFLLRDVEKPTEWHYGRNRAEVLARAALAELEDKNDE